MYPLIVVMALLLSGCAGGSSTSASNNASSMSSSNSSTATITKLNLVPLPSNIKLQKSTLTLGLEAKVQADPNTISSQAALTRLMTDLGIQHNENAPYSIQLVLISNTELGDEGYTLAIDKGIIISAQTDTGLFYGVQTLKQLLPATVKSSYTLPQVMIIDSPRYAFRGSMIDVARNFFSIEYLKKHIERMALFKLNKLHLHLSDDQGWRVEIKKYPNLTAIGGSTKVGGGAGGFYTQEQLKDLIAFAEQHHVEIIPELDMPGHTQAAIASYNMLACDDVTNLDLYTGTEVGFSSLCLTKPDITYAFVKDVLSEIAAIFPSRYIHIGGDEIKNPLYAEFITKANIIIKDLNKIMIGWEESSVATLSSDTLLQLWNDNYDIKSAQDRNIHLILSPCSYTYLDHANYKGQPDTYKWCREEGLPLERVFAFEPQNFLLVAGIEAPVWTELVTTEAALDNRLWPRLSAIAELAWSMPTNKNYADFISRLSPLKAQFDKMGVNYYPEPQLGW